MTPREELEALRRIAELEAKADGAKAPAAPDAFDEKIRAEANAPGGFMVNLGAGANNVIQGVKQLIGKGETDEQIDERRAMNDRAAGDSTLNSATQMLGEVLPTLAIPGLGVTGIAAKGAARVLPHAVGAAAKKALGTSGRVLTAANAGKGAAVGAGQSLLNATKTDESAVPGMVLGGVAGAAAPAVANVGARIYDRFSAKATPVATRAWNAIREKLGPDEMGRVSEQVTAPTAATLPSMTTAALADSAPTAALERGTRSRMPNVRNEVDLPRNQAAFDRVMDNTVEPDAVKALRTETTANVQGSNEAMRLHKDPAALVTAVTKLEKEVGKIAKSSEFAVNKSVQDAVAKVEASIMDPNVNPERLSLLVEELQALNEKAGPAFGPKITELQNRVREAVERSTGGMQSFKQGVLQADQQAVDAATDSARLRGAFVSPEGVPLGKRIGDTPVIEDEPLRDVLGKTPNLDPAVRDEMTVLADALRRSELHKPSNSPGPTGLDLTEPLSILGTGSNNPLRWIPGVPGLSRKTTGRANDATTKKADEMLLYPGKWTDTEDMLEALRNASPSVRQQLLKNSLNLPGVLTGSQVGE